MAPLHVIALISGGKDSLYSILHCLANGHHVVALANLHPAPASCGDDEDLNSFMYQTVGASVIPLYEHCLGIPLFRQELAGSAVSTAKDYEYTAGPADETEALVPLLQKVKEAFPKANAVSTGAILSTYQRTRVESVAVRLGLTPLSYLWQYPFLPPYVQSSLLTDMDRVGQDSRIIKTASGGIEEHYLNENVANPRTIARMKRAIARFSENCDGALLGEGGEFETLAVDGPSMLWKKKIVLKGTMLRQDGGTAVLKAEAELAEKEPDCLQLSSVRKPETFDDEFFLILKEPLRKQDGIVSLPSDVDAPAHIAYNEHHKYNDTIVIQNMVSYGHSRRILYQFARILTRLDEILKHYNTHKKSVAQCTLLLRHMKDFTLINHLYAQYFDFTCPPSRVTVAIGDCMDSSIDVMLSVVACVDGPRKGLHVQSQSYWAPANIGPYSQAISVPLFKPLSDPDSPADSSGYRVDITGYEVHIAGQIPLDPPSMTMYTQDGFKGEALLSLQHLIRIARHENVSWFVAGVAMLPSNLSTSDQHNRVLTAQAVWTAAHRVDDKSEDTDGLLAEDRDLDPWDAQNFRPEFDDRVLRPRCPNPSKISRDCDRTTIPPCFAAEVEALPRAAPIEWYAPALNAASLAFATLVSEAGSPNTPLFTLRVVTAGAGNAPNQARFFTLEIAAPGAGSDASDEDADTDAGARAHDIDSRDGASDADADIDAGGEGPVDVLRVQRLLRRQGFASGTLFLSRRFVDRNAGKWTLPGLAVVPCRRVWGTGREVLGVVVARGVGT